MPDRPIISALIATYNRRDLLSRSLPSVLAQDLGDGAFEVIVVDDGSTDGTPTAIAEIAAVQYVRQENRGQPAALNHGVRLARGELLAFNDADDVWTEGRLSAQLAALAETSLDAVFGHVEQFLEPDAPAAIATALTPARRILPSRLHTAMLVRRPAFDRVGAFREDLRIGSVMDWAHRAQQAGLQTRVLDSIVLRRRLHGGNTGFLQKSKASEDYLAVAKAALARRRGKTS